VKFEIGHLLLIDIVGYSKLLITEQRQQFASARVWSCFAAPKTGTKAEVLAVLG